MPRPKLYPTEHPNLKRTTKDRHRPHTIYYGDFRAHGVRYRPNLGGDKGAALAKLQGLIQARRGVVEEDKEGLTLGQAQRAHLGLYEVRIRGSTLKRYLSSDRNALEGLGDIPLTQITKQLINKWVSDRARATSTTTANRDLTRLRQVLRWASDNDWIDKDPSRGLKKFSEAVKRVRYLTKDEEERLKPGCSDWLWRMIRFAYLTGLRFQEQASLTWAQLEGGTISLEASKTKGNAFREIPISKAVRGLLEAQEGTHKTLVFPSPNGKVFDRGGFRKWHWRPAFDRAKLENFVWHDLRHTFCSRLVMAGVSLATVGELAGHKSLQVTMRYAYLAPEHLQAAVELLD